MKILQIGPLSNVGGISVHIRRVVHLLKDGKGFDFLFIDESPKDFSNRNYYNVRRLKDFFHYWKSIKQADIVHIHSGNWLLRLHNLFWANFFRKKVIVTLHSLRLSKFKRKLTELFVSRVNTLIAVSKEILQPTPFCKGEFIIKEAFIPPFAEEEKELPYVISERIKKLCLEKTLLCANAYRLTTYHKMDLYGLDQCIQVAKLAKEDDLKILIIFVIGIVNKDDKLYHSFLSEIETEQLEDYLYIIPQSISFITLMKACQIVLRPTLSDGDALTIREAIYLNKKVIASDTVTRPPGVTLYKTGDYRDLFLKIKDNIQSSDFNGLSESNGDEKEDYFRFYENLYNKCYN